MLEIPNAALLNSRTLRHLMPRYLVQKLSAIQLISLFLCLHRHTDKFTDRQSSLFLPYIDTLPRSFKEIPLWWTASSNFKLARSLEKLLKLAPEHVQLACKAIENRFNVDWKAVTEAWVRAFCS